MAIIFDADFRAVYTRLTDRLADFGIVIPVVDWDNVESERSSQTSPLSFLPIVAEAERLLRQTDLRVIPRKLLEQLMGCIAHGRQAAHGWRSLQGFSNQSESQVAEIMRYNSKKFKEGMARIEALVEVPEKYFLRVGRISDPEFIFGKSGTVMPFSLAKSFRLNPFADWHEWENPFLGTPEELHEAAARMGFRPTAWRPTRAFRLPLPKGAEFMEMNSEGKDVRHPTDWKVVVWFEDDPDPLAEGQPPKRPQDWWL